MWEEAKGDQVMVEMEVIWNSDFCAQSRVWLESLLGPPSSSDHVMPSTAILPDFPLDLPALLRHLWAQVGSVTIFCTLEDLAEVESKKIRVKSGIIPMLLCIG